MMAGALATMNATSDSPVAGAWSSKMRPMYESGSGFGGQQIDGDGPSKDPGQVSITGLAGPMQGATTYTPDDSAMVSSQLGKLLSKDSDYMLRARTKAAQSANSRGLLSSSIAAGAGESAAIDAALPIAQQDANSNFTSQRDNAGALNTFASQNNAFAQNAALAQYQGGIQTWAKGLDYGLSRDQLAADTAYKQGTLGLQGRQLDADTAYQQGQLSNQSRGIDLQGRQLDADTAYRNADLGFRRDASNRDLSLQETKAQQDQAYREQQLAQQQSQFGATNQLDRDRLDASKGQIDQQARTSLANNIADIRRQASQSQAQLEADPNMSAEAKARAIANLSAKASADIAEVVRFSGLNMASAWPDWINTLGSPTAAPAPAPGAAPAPAPTPAPAPAGDQGNGQPWSPAPPWDQP